MGVFRPALEEMKKSGKNYFGPMSFQQYLRENGFSKKRTAAFISVDSVETIDSELRSENMMVFRLGRGVSHKETQFVIVKSNNINDFFLIDDEIFGNQKPEIFETKLSSNELFTFKIFPNPSETTLVNLGLSTGVIGEALNLDKKEYLIAPTTISSNFNFKVNLHKSSEEIFDHISGQVEIDCLLLGKRNGKNILFVIEAKKEGKHKSIAKHKIAYPILSIEKNIPMNLTIIPVYIKIHEYRKQFIYKICECKPYSCRKSTLPITSIEAINPSIFQLNI